MTVSALAQELSVIEVLWRRDLLRFFRERMRIAGAVIQPLIFWFILGSGMTPTFHLQCDATMTYMQYFFPGVIVMVILFTSIFTTMSVIEDRHNGFLQTVMAAPASRTSLVLGKASGSTSVALIQSALFVALAPLAGFSYAQLNWPLLAAGLTVCSLGLSALGFVVAWWTDSTQSYHVVMSVVLIPLWVLSGAMFSANEVSWLGWIRRANPLSYAVDVVRHAFIGASAPRCHTLQMSSVTVSLGVLVAFALVAIGFASWLCRRVR